MTRIRAEKPEDVSQVRAVNEAAFGQSTEADIVNNMRLACEDSPSLVAEDGLVVGHVLFAPVVVESPEGRVVGMGLAPMAVLPDRQRHGIGGKLVRRGLEILRDRGCPFVIVLGRPKYYPLRVRARIRARPLESVGRPTRRGVHGSDL